MRGRRKRNLDKRIDCCGKYLLTPRSDDLNFATCGGVKSYFDFEEIFGNNHPVDLEIGCGKGQFACEMAKRNPEINYIAVEKSANVIVNACERAEVEKIENVRFVQCSAEYLIKYIPPKTVGRIYLNFSCPYPKNTYASHRLTSERFLEIYKIILKDSGEIHQKTDNQKLFEFSIEKFSENGFALKNIALDLHKSPFEGNIVTEYEHRFSQMGMPIYRLEAYIPRKSTGNSIDTVIFDMDGTILNTIDDLHESVNHVLRANGYPERSLKEVLSFVGNGIGRLVKLSIPQGHSDAEFDRVLAQFTEYYTEHMNDKTRPYEGITALMSRLKKAGYKMAIVSNKFQAGVDELKSKYYTDVDVALGEQAGIPKKPAPDTVNMALEMLGSKKENAVYIGDSEVDLETAQNAGLPCIAVLWGFRTKDELLKAGATVFAEKPRHIDKIIKSL